MTHPTMTDDDIFRLVLTAGIAVLLPIGAYYRIRSQATGEKLDRRQEGWFILIGLRLVAALRMVAILAFLANPAWMAWSAVPLPVWLRWVGVAIGAAAGVLLVRTFHTLGPNLTDTVVTRRKHTLVQHGPYHWVRHPFYVAFCLAVVADSLATANWFVLVTGLSLVAFLVARTRKEEENLVRRFGDAYVAYSGRTGRFWPRLRSVD